MTIKRSPHDLPLGFLTDVFEAASDIALNLLNKDYTVLWANKLMALRVECPLNEMIGKPCYEAWGRRINPCPICPLKIVTETRKPFIGETWFDLPEKERCFGETRAYPVFDTEGFVKHIFEIIIPMTDKKKKEERRRKYITLLEDTLGELNALGVADLKGPPTGEKHAALTTREKEVLRLVARGFSNREIAGILRISPHTVKTHIKNIFFKLAVTDRALAAVWAVSHGVI